MDDQWFDDAIQIAFHDERKIVKGQFDAVISDAVLGKIIGADAFVAFASADLAFAQGCVFGMFLRDALLEQSRPQNGQRAGFVLLL